MKNNDDIIISTSCRSFCVILPTIIRLPPFRQLPPLLLLLPQRGDASLEPVSGWAAAATTAG